MSKVYNDDDDDNYYYYQSILINFDANYGVIAGHHYPSVATPILFKSAIAERFCR